MSRPCPKHRWKHRGKPPPHRYKKGGFPVRPILFQDFGLKAIYDLVLPTHKQRFIR